MLYYYYLPGSQEPRSVSSVYAEISSDGQTLVVRDNYPFCVQINKPFWYEVGQTPPDLFKDRV